HLRLPGTIADLFELLVAMMLLVLGARSIVRAFAAGRGGADHAHHHGSKQHSHAGIDDHVHVAAWTLGRRPLLIGLMHGLAGSGALTALALASMPTLGSGLIYMVLFGLGSIAGMALLTGLADLPLRALSQRRSLTIALNAAAGTIALGLGVMWGWPLLLRLTAV
ncbi:MAG TPA: hypothetical protein VHZ95_12710, partial [Polyangiales bacterium]|nr:hypothetical protein [Polyangiales bacterium]